LPAAQLEQEEAPSTALNLPAGHAVQAEAEEPLYVPAEHLVQADAPVPLYVPAEQLVQAVAAEEARYLPAGHTTAFTSRDMSVTGMALADGTTRAMRNIAQQATPTGLES